MYIDRNNIKVDKEMFLKSMAFVNYMWKHAFAITGKPDIKVKISNRICTNGQIIEFNPFWSKLKDLDIATTIMGCEGQIDHEAFHIRYTDFETLVALKQKYLPISSFTYNIAHNVMNIIEDSAIELAGTNEFIGTVEPIRYLNELAFEEMKPLDELENCSRLDLFLTASAQYIIIGKLKGEIPDAEVKEVFNKAKKWLKRGRYGKTSWDRLSCTNKIMELIMDFVGEAEMLNMISQFFYPKNMEISNDPSNEPVTSPRITFDPWQDQTEDQEETDSESQEANSGSSENGDTESDGKDKEVKSKDKTDTDSGANKDTDSSQENGQQKNGGNKNTKGTPSSNQFGTDNEKKSREDIQREAEEAKRKAREKFLEDLEKDIKELNEQVKDEEVQKRRTAAQERKLLNDINGIQYNNIHYGVRNQVRLNFDNGHREEDIYNRTLESLLSLAKLTARQLEDEIRFNEEEKLTGLDVGTLDIGRVWRKDVGTNIFYQRKGKSEEKDLAIMVIVDRSGSMYHNESEALRALVFFQYVCKQLRIPHSIIGCQADFYSSTVFHDNYINFHNCFSPSVEYNLAHYLGAYNNTREGYSLKYAGEILKSQPQRDKILISISDGDPMHLYGDYRGEVAMKDTLRTRIELENHGIECLGIAIGPEAPRMQIDKLYRNFIRVPNLEELPAKFIRIIKDNLFVN